MEPEITGNYEQDKRRGRHLGWRDAKGADEQNGMGQRRKSPSQERELF